MKSKILAKDIITKKGGTLIPTFNRDICIMFFNATGDDLITTLETMVKEGEIKKDFYRWTPKKYDTEKRTRWWSKDHFSLYWWQEKDKKAQFSW